MPHTIFKVYIQAIKYHRHSSTKLALMFAAVLQFFSFKKYQPQLFDSRRMTTNLSDANANTIALNTHVGWAAPPIMLQEGPLLHPSNLSTFLFSRNCHYNRTLYYDDPQDDPQVTAFKMWWKEENTAALRITTQDGNALVMIFYNSPLRNGA